MSLNAKLGRTMSRRSVVAVARDPSSKISAERSCAQSARVMILTFLFATPTENASGKLVLAAQVSLDAKIGRTMSSRFVVAAALDPFSKISAERSCSSKEGH